jgi:predicted DNA-binding transcriptional regulator YafY
VKELGKRDRTARLLRIEHLLYQNHEGLSVQKIADLCGVTKRTIYRDLAALESKLDVKLWEEGSTRGIVEGYFLPPIHFTPPEALNIFLASRLMLNYAHRYDPNVASVFTKLNSIVPPPLAHQIQKTMEWMQKQPKDERYLRILATLAQAWVSQRQAKISYKALYEKKAVARTIEPYFIEPAAPGHASYVIAYCHHTRSLRTFKIERIDSVELAPKPYVIPPDFDANAYLGSSWGIVVEGEVEAIKLRFDPELARIMEETVWHPSQVLEPQRDGSVTMTLKVTNTVELYSWILGWGEKVEVLEPEELRQQMIETARAMLDVYQRK